MHKSLFLSAFFVLFNFTTVYAADYIKSYIPDYKLVGEGRLRYMMFDVYDASLYASQGQFKFNQPLALQLVYLRDIKGHKIADRSAEEMRNIGIKDEIKLAAWHTQMRRIFPDVTEGVTLTGILNHKQESVFFKNGIEIGRITDPAFGEAFFGIWLNEKTSSPKLRLSLLGQR